MDNAFRESDDSFRQLADNITDAFWIRSPDMQTVHYVSPAFERIWGRPVSSLYANPERWPEFIFPADRERVVAAFAGLVNTTPSLEIEYRIVRPGGEIRWVCVRGFQIRDAADALIRHAGIVTDITEHKKAELEIARTNRSLTMLGRCNEMVIRAVDEQELLDRICRIAVDDGGYRTAWVSYSQDAHARSLCPMAHAGIQDDSLSVILLPLRNAAQVFGELGLRTTEPLQLTPAELALLQGMADNVAFGIGNLRAQLEGKRLQACVLSVAAGVSSATGTAFFEQLTLNMADALEANAAFVAQVLPIEPPTARTIAAVVDGQVTGNVDFLIVGSPCEPLLTIDTCVASGEAAGRFPDSPFLEGIAARSFVGHRLTSSSGQALGLLFVVFRTPLRHTELSTSTLQIFAARAASELERQNTDAQVREQAALLDVAHDAIQVKDLDGRILYWNKGAERLYGWTAAEVVGRQSEDLLYKESGLFDHAHTTLLSKDEWQGEVAMRTRHGKALIVEARWTLVRDAHGRPISILAINTDITAKKRLESQFLRAQRMEGIGTLAGGIAHDLNNVLTPILMSIAMLKGVVTTDEDLALVATLEGSAQRGADLVKQVLTYARGVEGERVSVNPLHVMRELLTVIRDTFPKSIDVRFMPPKDLWAVRGDSSQIHQVFLNLCINARDAMPAGGVLTIRMSNVVLDDDHAGVHPDSRPGAYVLVAIGDNGTGIPVEARHRIFEPFFTTREIGKGTGLGLSTTQAIVQSHGGFIELYTEVGRGTTFTVYFPATTSESVTDDGVAAAAAPRIGHGELVLVVDDEEALCRVAQRMLEKFGYRVLMASNGADALVVYATHRDEIALVLTDMAMPVMGGQALIAALRALNPLVRIIGSSGLPPGELELGIGHFVAKPYTAATLLEALHNVLHGRLPAAT